MRKRAEVKKVSDIKKDPDLRIVFPKENYQEFINFLSIGNKYAINPTTLARHLVLIFARKVISANEPHIISGIMTEIMQSIHGLHQINIFDKAVTVEKTGKERVNEVVIKHLKGVVPLKKKVGASRVKAKAKGGK
jgi:hypothetical protein